MQKLNLPTYSYKLQKKNEKNYIFDPIRQKYLVLTPEEWVRQHFVHYLLQEKGVPPSLINNEIIINKLGLLRRCDSVIYSSQMAPLVIVEYKAPSVKITQKVFDQIAAYNIQLKVPFLIFSNGLKHYCCKIKPSDNKVVFLKNIPSYSEILEHFEQEKNDKSLQK